MVTPEFENAYKRLNPEQKLAVDTIEGPVMVVAGPGTGKTQILTLRIANILLQTDTNPGNILALTFTESGVFQMRKRLVSIIGTPGYKVEISTFHSFCNDVIRNNPEDFPHLISSEAITELEQIQLMEEILEAENLNLLRPFGDSLYYLRPALSSINELKKEGVTPDEFKEAIEKQKQDFEKIEDLRYEKGANLGKMKGKYQDLQRAIAKNEELLIIYRAYQKALVDKKLYDFNDMLLEVIAALEKDESLLLRLQERYQYILVDEHQDTNAAQNKIIELLSSFYEIPNLFVVGDEKQAIFRFQGASLENFLYFQKLYPSAVLINLKQNYRSTQIILDAADSLISNNLLSTLLLPNQTLSSNVEFDLESIKIAEFNEANSEYFWVGEKVKELLNQKVSPSEIAILGRNNQDVLPLIDILEDLSIPFTLESDANILYDPYVARMIFILRAVEELGNDAPLVRALHMDFLKIDPLDIYKLIKYSQKKEIFLTELLSEDKEIEISLKDLSKIRDFFKKQVEWNKESKNEPLNCLFVDILKQSGLLEAIMQSKNSTEVLDKFASLYTDIKIQQEKKPNFSLADFLNYLTLLETHRVSIKKTSHSAKRLGVRLMTAHKSKGLEFEYVFIINSFDGHWGNARKKAQFFQIPWSILSAKAEKISEPSNEGSSSKQLNEQIEFDPIEDERRLFYVSLTRAKKEIFITYSNTSIDGKEQNPSQFISEISDDFKQDLNIKEFEERLLKDKQRIFISKKPIDSSAREKQFLESKEFFSQFFFERGLSATGLNNYLDCPWKFVFRNLLLLPDVKTKQAVFGSAIHYVLSCYLKASNKELITSDFLIQKYLEFLSREHLYKKDKEELMEKGKVVIDAYFKYIKDYLKGDFLSEFEVKGIKFSDNVTLNGRIDMIEVLDKKGKVRTYDFKTGQPKSRNQIEGLTQTSNGSYKRQLVFYKLLLDRYQNGKMQMTEGVIEFVEPDKKGEFKRGIFEITDEEIKLLEFDIARVSDEIANLSFWYKSCDDKKCEYCQLRSYIS